ncbi:MAG: indolepyruvate ferredoxin oxidoreductase subunit alpha [Brevinema sp.]
MPHFINDSCINCGACEPVCPVGCISEVNGSARYIDEATCIDCDACTPQCPVDAIHVR